MKLAVLFLILASAALIAVYYGYFVSELEPYSWSITQRGGVLEIAYGRWASYPQYAALHLDGGYFRMNYGPGSSWGTSIILPPSFWERGVYYQGSPLTCSWEVRGEDLLISFSGKISNLTFRGSILIYPPRGKKLKATVNVSVEGSIELDNRPCEAFKPVMLSSMRVSRDLWDVESAYVESRFFRIPEEGWITLPCVEGRTFGLKGGTSYWKVNSPTIEVTLDREMKVTGWVTRSSDPNDDNVGFWASLDQLANSWQYTITAKP